MNLAPKFGSFGGVFAPSILTILGVIMYLRLPWIVGQAGLYATIGIILVAHIISVTTGLSVASIATDKRLSVGGNYYIISRSLGLSIGGTLGLALFVGLSFSISLYIIGFVESFLPAWGIEPTRDAIRLYGSIALLAVSAIILISTSLAIRVQYVIMAAIVLSIISIVLGETSAPQAPLLSRPQDGASLMLLFGIFFPAVTGFTAGVQMSGDLRDPRASIPRGTIAAILVGFVVYVALAVFFAFRFDAEALSQRDILSDVSWYQPILYAGIWGATLSSAMGSLLGAPRILQATSMDRITPHFFARGRGPANEPRNALLLSFVIAEAGILVAELDVIAAIISIFFITTYGFINLSCAIENWASADFRPSFRIPTWVSVFGSVACVLVMIQLDLLAFLGASLLLALVYTYLKKRELTLESGDTWEGVWSSVTRSGLQQLAIRRPSQRNWRPNIILFSGGSGARPYLIEFGRWLVDKRGLLSNFDLKEIPDRDQLLNKPKNVSMEGAEIYEGIFHRNFECRDFYEGMETIAQVYGFSGVEPNTIMMGWARKSRDPERFARVIRHLSIMDYNILLLDYDRSVGFGSRKSVDVWWQDGSRNAQLALTIVKYLKTSEAWQHAAIRMIVVIEDSAVEARVSKNMAELLETERLQMDIRIINNAIERRPRHEIVQAEYRDTDLTILSIPDVQAQPLEKFVDEMDAVISGIGSTLLINASTYFEELSIGLEIATSPSNHADPRPTKVKLPDLPTPDNLPSGSHITLYNHLMRSYGEIERHIQQHSLSEMTAFNAVNLTWLEELGRLVDRTFQTIRRRTDDLPPARAARFIGGSQSDTLFQLKRQLLLFQTVHLPAQKEQLASSMGRLIEGVDQAIRTCPDISAVILGADELALGPADPARVRLLKLYQNMKRSITKKPVTLDIKSRNLLESLVSRFLLKALSTQMKVIGIASYELMSDVRKWANATYASLGGLESLARENRFEEEDIETRRSELSEQLASMGSALHDRFELYGSTLQQQSRRIIATASKEIVQADVNQRINRFYRVSKPKSQLQAEVRGIPALWARNQDLMITFTTMDISVMVFRHRLQTIVARVQDEIRISCESKVVDPLRQIERTLEGFDVSTHKDEANVLLAPMISPEPIRMQELIEKLREDVMPALADLPETLDILSEEAFKHLDKIQFAVLDTVSISLRRQIEYLVETDLLAPLQEGLTPIAECFRTCIEITDDVVRLIKFNLESGATDDETSGIDPVESLTEILTDSIDRIATERVRMELELLNGLDLIRDRMRSVTEAMNPYWLTRTATHLGQNIRAHEGKKLIARYRDQITQIKQHSQRALVRLMYTKSEGVLFARGMSGSMAGMRTRVGETIDLVRAVSPGPGVLTALPFYYRQLFLSKQPIRQEFWIRRPTERRQAERAYARHKAGHYGAILVLGNANAGRTTLCRRLAEAWCTAQKVVHLYPPEGGCIDPMQLKSRLEDAVKTHGDYDEIFRAIPQGGVLVINDLELWWERSPGGMAVIDVLLELVDRFSDRITFLVNTNPYSYQIINQVRTITQSFVGVVECGPFDVEEIQQAVLRRHRSTGLSFQLSGHDEPTLSDFALARLFTRYFDVSSGNIGVAFQTWISAIDSVSGESLSIHTPTRPAIDPLLNMDWEWMVWMQQFVIHKHLTEGRVARIFRSRPNQVIPMIFTLKRAGLLIESQPGILEINPYIRPLIVQALREIEML